MSDEEDDKTVDCELQKMHAAAEKSAKTTFPLWEESTFLWLPQACGRGLYEDTVDWTN